MSVEKHRKLKIVGGPEYWSYRVVDAETGEMIDGISKLEFTLDPGNMTCTVTLTLTQFEADVEVASADMNIDVDVLRYRRVP